MEVLLNIEILFSEINSLLLSYQMFMLCCIRREQEKYCVRKKKINLKMKRIWKYKDLFLLFYVENLHIKTTGISWTT